MKRKLKDLDLEELFSKKLQDEDNSSDAEDDDNLSDAEICGEDTGENSSDAEICAEDDLSDADDNEDQTTSKTENGEEQNDDANSEDELDFEKHIQSLKKLKHAEPEFYKFLEENDQDLLNFDVDSGTDSEEDESDKKHKIPTSLEVASDESDEEEEEIETEAEHKKSSSKISKPLLRRWSKELKESRPVSAIAKVISALKSAVELLSDEDASSAKRIQNSKALNGLLRMSIVDLVPAFNRVLHVSADVKSFQPTLSKSWKKLQTHAKTYLILIVKVLDLVNEDQIVGTLIKHILELVPYYGAFNKVSKALLKRLITIWSTAEESLRVLSYLAISAVTRQQMAEILPFVINNMYVSYVKNCKFTSPITWPLINFMKHSLAGIFSLDESHAYQHAFVYIRQMAIHLRNAITLKKKDAIKTVYNWQFIHCLYLWSRMLSEMHQSTIMQPLIYPLVQIIIGTIKIIPTAKYIPLRFHCIRALTLMTKETNTFIPVLPLLTEVLPFVNVKKHNTKVNWKPMDFLCALKLSKSQITENGFKDAIIEQFCELTLDYTSTQAHGVAFSELVLPSIIQMKAFVKTCSNSKYNRDIKQIVEKLEENARHIEQKRSSTVLNLSDAKAMEAWENASKQASNPLTVYYTKYRELRDREVLLNISKKDQISDRFPEIERTKPEDKKEFNDLFAENLSDDDNDSFFFQTKKISNVKKD
uniref:Nucleolar complex protein 2 homolog n=1 Tax=Strigamia maritima TaxID=126957 RepID=T1J4B2_STRMM